MLGGLLDGKETLPPLSPQSKLCSTGRIDKLLQLLKPCRCGARVLRFWRKSQIILQVLDRRCINSAASENHCIQVFELWYLMPWIEVQSARRTVLSPLCVAQVEVGCGV